MARFISERPTSRVSMHQWAGVGSPMIPGSDTRCPRSWCGPSRRASPGLVGARQLVLALDGPSAERLVMPDRRQLSLTRALIRTAFPAPVTDDHAGMAL